MVAVFLRVVMVLVLLGGCGPPPEPDSPVSLPAAGQGRSGASPLEAQPLWEPCTRQQAETWLGASGREWEAALRGASCYGFLASQDGDPESRLADARSGRDLAETAVKTLPGSGLAHYVYAYLTALVAEGDPMRGLELVPVIERQALLAAELNPAVDHGGPDRMLGELYLRAPSFPVSIGDPANAVVHYRRAVRMDPDYMESRLGLAEALLEEEKIGEACEELLVIMAHLTSSHAEGSLRRQTLKLMKRVCRKERLE